ncbi:MAG: EAL domain-containing protein [Deltaproteobacteria bacterium]|nr:EAL domain-containing protein [Deltaproteobacteria bacterium]
MSSTEARGAGTPLELIPLLRALERSLEPTQSRAQRLCADALELLEARLEEEAHLSATATPAPTSATEHLQTRAALGRAQPTPATPAASSAAPASLVGLCKWALDYLACPASWLTPSAEDAWVSLHLEASRRALALLLSQLSQVTREPRLSVTPSGQGVTLQLEALEAAPSLFGRLLARPYFERDLAHARGVIERNGGTLTLTPTAEGGVRLSCRFPKVERWVSFTPSSEEQSATREGLIWLIDDEAPVRLTVRRWLTRLGYTVELFEDGAALLERLAAAAPPPTLLICDADMPAMPGIEVLARARAARPDVKRVLYTAHEPSRWVIEAFNQGVIHRFLDKNEGPDALRQCLDELLAQSMADRASLLALDELLRQDLITLYVQPIFSAGARRIEACEALMRSAHPLLKGPLDVLSATTLARRELDLQRALTRLTRALRERLPERVALFMNIDPVIFGQPQALDDVLGEMYPYASSVVLELTERGQLCGDAWQESVRLLRARGFRVALDDLGAGYNSLGAVAAISPEIIKLDISLVSNVHLSAPKREMVRLLSEYALRHGIQSLAEGIELEEEARVCEALGVRWLQGFHLSRPAPFDQLAAELLRAPPPALSAPLPPSAPPSPPAPPQEEQA